MNNQDKNKQEKNKITDNYSFESLRAIFGKRCVNYYTQQSSNYKSKKE